MQLVADYDKRLEEAMLEALAQVEDVDVQQQLCDDLGIPPLSLDEASGAGVSQVVLPPGEAAPPSAASESTALTAAGTASAEEDPQQRARDEQREFVMKRLEQFRWRTRRWPDADAPAPFPSPLMPVRAMAWVSVSVSVCARARITR